MNHNREFLDLVDKLLWIFKNIKEGVPPTTPIITMELAHLKHKRDKLIHCEKRQLDALERILWAKLPNPVLPKTEKVTLAEIAGFIECEDWISLLDVLSVNPFFPRNRDYLIVATLRRLNMSNASLAILDLEMKAMSGGSYGPMFRM